MPKTIPNLANASKTDADFPPHCEKLTVARRPAGVLLWTLTLVWTLDENNVRTVQLPDCFGDRDRTRLLRAFEGTGGATQIKEDPMMQIEAALHVAVGAERLPLVMNAVVVVKRIELIGSEGSALVRTLLLVETKRDQAPEMTDALKADVHVTVAKQIGLFERLADGVNEDGDAVNEADAAAEAGAATSRKPRTRKPADQPTA